MSDWDDIMAQLDVGPKSPVSAASTSNAAVWQQKYAESETKLKTMEAENAALKERMSRFALIAEEVRKERRMHEEDLEAERSRTADAEQRAEEYETKLIQLATLVTQMKEQHTLELTQARQSASAVEAGNSQTEALRSELKAALGQAAALNERAAMAEQQVLALQAQVDSETVARAQAEESSLKAKAMADGVQAKFMKLAEISKNLRAQNEELLGQVEALKSAAGSAASNSSAQAQEVTHLQSKLAAATADATSWKQKQHDSEAHVKVLDNEIGTLKAKLAAAADANKSSGQATSAQLAQIEAELKETRAQRDKALAEAKAMDDKFTTLMPKITADRDRSKAEIATLVEARTKLEADLAEAQTKFKTAETVARSAKAKLEEVSLNSKASAADSDKLVADLDKSKQLVNKLRDELTASKTYVAALEERVTKAQATAQAARSEASGADPSVVERLKTENAALRDRVTAADSKAANLTRQIATLRDQLDAASSGSGAAPAPASAPAFVPAPPAPGIDAAGPPGPPPPPPAGGPPPPPPPPPAGGAAPKKGLTITRSAKSTAALSASSSASSSSGGGGGDPQSALLAAIAGGVKLKKSTGPEDVDAKLKRLEAQKKAEAPKGPTGSPLADFASLGLMAKQLALKRTARVEAQKEAPTRGRHDPVRQSVRLTNLLDNI
jgi:chromosome segregation ATPase